MRLALYGNVGDVGICHRWQFYIFHSARGDVDSCCVGGIDTSKECINTESRINMIGDTNAFPVRSHLVNQFLDQI